jgi:hypothetical protein
MSDKPNLLNWLATHAETADLTGLGKTKVTWAFRAVRPDLRSREGFRYPWPGQWATAPGPIIKDNDGPCPSDVGDGLCVAKTFFGASQGGISLSTLLLVGYTKRDVLGEDESKARVKRMYIADLLDVATVLRSADLGSANLGYANLRYADLRSADLRSANLRYADLGSANLRYADLGYANLGYADLRSANLRYANLRSANLRYADLRSANLRYANLRSANLGYATYNQLTLWPDSFDPVEAGAVKS